MGNSRADAMRDFRKRRAVLDIIPVSASIPSNRREEFSIFVARLLAERYIEIINEGDYKKLEIVAAANLSSYPRTDMIASLEQRYAADRDFVKVCVRCRKAVFTCNSAIGALSILNADNVNDQEQRVRWRAIAVANSALAAALWRELQMATMSNTAALPEKPKDMQRSPTSGETPNELMLNGEENGE